MDTNTIRSKFLEFFKARGHAILPSASLIPQNDPSVLFNTAGMQPLGPYLLGEKHPLGNRLASCQKCVRTGDIDDVGDNRHLTFFEMLGNWSLGDYFKEEAIAWSYEFLTSKQEGLGLDPKRLYVTVFEGDNNAPKDIEAVEIWKKFVPENRIYFLPAKNNWWSPGENGPCGPDTEMFYDITESKLGDLTHEEFKIADEKGDVVEIWNDVFMEYKKENGVVVGKLSQKNVDTGSGLERVAMVVQGKKSVFETDLFEPMMSLFPENFSEVKKRIITDHIKTSIFLISDGVIPSNKDKGYVLRKLIRRAVVHANGIDDGTIFSKIGKNVIDKYKSHYENLDFNKIMDVLLVEVSKFQLTLNNGLREFEKGTDPFILATTHGFPIEVIEELAKERGTRIDRESFDQKMAEHQALSRSGAEQKFKGGLANTNEQTVKLHTAHHLLLAALKVVLGEGVKQRGSNITEERLRIDFTYDNKLTDEQKNKVQEIVNEKIKENLKVARLEMPKLEAEKLGAEMEFGAKYPDVVSVYVIENKDGSYFSKEFCGGPHAANTGDLASVEGPEESSTRDKKIKPVFKIVKEEAVAQGVRRIKAVLLAS